MPRPQSTAAIILSALHEAGDPAWRDRVRAAWTGTVAGTAQVLGIGRATLFRWLEGEQGLRDELGVRPGPPRKPL